MGDKGLRMMSMSLPLRTEGGSTIVHAKTFVDELINHVSEAWETVMYFLNTAHIIHKWASSNASKYQGDY